MKNITEVVTSPKWIGLFLACLAMNAIPAELHKRTPMETQPHTFWQLLEALEDQPSLSPDKVVATLPVSFVEKKRNAYFSFHDGGSIGLADQVGIEKVELRTNLEDETRGLLLLDLAGTCLPVDQVRAHYPDITLTEQPRGRSPDEETTYSVQQRWGLLSFGFKESNPGCLATVVLDRTSPTPAED